MKGFKLLTLLPLTLIAFWTWAQPQLSVEWTDENGAHACNQSTNCTCAGSFLGVAFGPLVPPLTRTVVVTVRNSGTGSLTIGTPVFTPSPNWSISFNPVIGAGINLPSGTPLTITITFNPPVGASIGGDLSSLILPTLATVDCFEDANPATATDLDVRFNLSGTVLVPPTNFILALDRSGSMGQTWGTDPQSNPERKIDKLRKAASFFVGLSSLRPPEPGFSGDKLGLVKYSTVADGTYLPLAVVNSTLVTNASNLLSEGASNDINLIRPDGWTNMGDAVVKSFNQFPSGENNVLIVFSDGVENRSPLTSDIGFISSVLTPRQSDVDIYTIGMGNDVNATSMENLSKNSGFTTPRYFFLPDNFSGGTSQVLNPNSSSFALGSSYELNAIYLKIYAEAGGYAIPSDPEKSVCLCSGQQNIFDTWITSSDKHAIFSLFHEAGQRESFQLALLSPDGTTIAAGSMPNGLNVQAVSNADYTIYKVDFSGAAPSAFVGQWNVRFTPADATREVYAPIGFGALAFSDLMMETVVAAPGGVPGSEILLNVSVTESGIPISKVKSLLVKLLTPSGKKIVLDAQPDKFGGWTTRFPNTFDQGTYTFFVQANVVNSKGEATVREAVKYVALQNNYQTDTLKPTPCYSRQLIITVILVLIALVVLLGWFVRKARK